MTGTLHEHSRMRRAERLHVVLGDQLDRDAPALRELDKERDAVLMCEVRNEAEHVPSHRQRTALFLAAMRHFALDLIDDGYRVRYVALADRANTQALGSELERAVATLGPSRITVTRPGEHRVAEELAGAVPELDVQEDESFTCSLAEFDAWAEGRKELTLEFFYRERRRALDLLMEDDKPRGGQWNYDEENRHSFKSAPSAPTPYKPRIDATTREVLEMVRDTDAPGRLDTFRWPVTRAQARRLLDDFVTHRLADFGKYQDAMWTCEPFLFHSLLSPALNLKLLKPGECVDAAVAALADGVAPLNAVEGFVRQIIGWREFIRGVYYREGPPYTELNELGHDGRLPELYWTGDTEMACLRHCVGEVLEHGYGHHIARLMVAGNFALIAGVRPQEVHEWFLGMYVDAVEWVTAPNVIGMSQHADGGVVGTKPYAASGKYVQRMSNYCRDCRYDVKARTGPDACPFNTFYWDFLIRHRERFARNRRMTMMLKNVDRLATAERKEIQKRGNDLRQQLAMDV